MRQFVQLLMTLDCLLILNRVVITSADIWLQANSTAKAALNEMLLGARIENLTVK